VEHIPQLGRITTQPMRMQAGRAIPSDTPGLGIAWDWDAIAHLAEPDLNFDLTETTI
jgi:L-alanine-DL-glutamate epimerase-like enolase superfamily enzyme